MYLSPFNALSNWSSIYSLSSSSLISVNSFIAYLNPNGKWNDEYILFEYANKTNILPYWRYDDYYYNLKPELRTPVFKENVWNEDGLWRDIDTWFINNLFKNWKNFENWVDESIWTEIHYYSTLNENGYLEDDITLLNLTSNGEEETEFWKNENYIFTMNLLPKSNLMDSENKLSDLGLLNNSELI